MLTPVQIVLLSIIGVCLLFSVLFMILFIVEICKRQENEATEEQEVQSVFTVNNNVNVVTTDEEKVEESVGDMLASLEEQTKGEEVVEEEPAKEEPEEVQETENANESAEEESEEDGSQDEVSDIKEIEAVGHEKITEGSLIDYKSRLEKVIELRDKIERDLTKRQKSILKYERTKRRMNRNQKMLDRKAGELTNLNLVMYSVTDIKNVDEEKKAKQEDLTAHIAELKASIQDAEEFIESNKEKNEDNIKMAKYLLNEQTRYNEEIAELEALIKSIEGEGNDTADKAE